MVYNLMNHIAHRMRPKGLAVYAKPRSFIPNTFTRKYVPLLKWWPKVAGLYNYVPATMVFMMWFAWPALGDFNQQYLKSLVFLAEKPVREEA